jgi:hypothetical protein
MLTTTMDLDDLIYKVQKWHNDLSCVFSVSNLASEDNLYAVKSDLDEWLVDLKQQKADMQRQNPVKPAVKRQRKSKNGQT